MYTSPKGVNFCIMKHDAVLLQQRDENCPYFPLQWCVPGGGKEVSETYKATAAREIAEEYEIVISESSLVFLTDRPANNPGKVYLVEVPADTAPIMHEGKAMQWLPISELETIALGFHQSTFITPALLQHYQL